MRGMEGATVLVAGGAGELGGAVVRDLGERGAHVVVADLDEAGARATAEHLGAGATPCRLDITDPDSVHDALSIAAAAPGSFTAVVVLAACYVGLSRVPVEEIPQQRWHTVLDVNVRGAAILAAAACTVLAASGGGHVVLLSSTTAVRGAPLLVDYAASKAAVGAVARSLAVGWGPHGVRVNCVVPGPLATHGTLDVLDDAGVTEITAGQAIPGLQTPEQLAGTVAFLWSGEAPYLTGQSLIVDGGKSRT